MNYEHYLNQKITSVPLSGIREVNNWPSKIPQSDWIRLNIGQPDLPTPSYIKNATIEAVNKNQTQYTHIMGNENLRQEISYYLKRHHGLEYEIEEIFVTSGGQSAIFALLKTILSSNDNVIVPFPCYPPYINAIKYNQANIIPIITRVENNFDIQLDQLEKVLETKTIKFLLLISPGNPTGALIPPKTQQAIVKLASDYDFLIISDEIYNRMIFQDEGYHSIAEIPSSKERTIVIQSFSKMLSMCGFRIGFIAAPKPVVNSVKIVHHTMNICANSLAQYAVYKALSNDEEFEKATTEIRDTYLERKNVCMKYLKDHEDLIISEPQGAFYIFPKTKYDMIKFGKWLKFHYGILTVPGIYFSIPEIQEFNKYLRISFTTDISSLEKGLKKICDVLSIYKD